MRLEETRAPLERLFLDPNNPRFADQGLRNPISANAMHEVGVQERAESRINDERYDVEALKQSIARNGYLPVDRMVVTRLPDDNGFMVVEGNRRLAALRLLVREDQAHEADITEEVRASLREVPVLVLEDDDPEAIEYKARLLQGVRHLSSFKQWGPYQQAQLVARMLEAGQEIADIKEALGMTAQRISSLRRVFYALAQMQTDPVYGDSAKPALFSQFEEALKIPAVRTWLSWDDAKAKITNDERRTLLYDWFIGVEDDGERQDPKIVDAKDIRRLPSVLESAKHMSRYLEDPRLKLRDVRVEDNPVVVDWRSILEGNLETLRRVPGYDLGHATGSDMDLLIQVRDTCSELIRQVEAIASITAEATERE